jgi:signal transduction histidine kinase
MTLSSYFIDSDGLEALSPYLVSGFGGVLFLAAVVQHGFEFYTLNELIGPLIAVLLDGLPALGLVYAGYWLAGADLSPEDRWRAWIWCLVGATLFVAVMGSSLLVRIFEGRVVAEPLFPLLIAAEAGGIGGVIAGYHTGRTRVETRQAQALSDALGFVNNLIRHDLRNNLNVIRGRANMVETDGGSADTGTEPDSVSIIAEEADEALARIETTGAVADTLIGDADFDRIDLGIITAEMVTSLENIYDLSVTTDIPGHAPVTANAGLRSVVDNLLENAVEHNDTDEPQVHVEVETDAETVRLSVTDDGPGIPDT